MALHNHFVVIFVFLFGLAEVERVFDALIRIKDIQILIKF